MFPCSDIVRDFTLASFKAKRLQDLQRKFLEAIISSVGDNASPKLSDYANTSLMWHMRGALIEPRSKDELVRRLVLHSDERTRETISGQVTNIGRPYSQD